MEARASCTLGKCCTAELHPAPSVSRSMNAPMNELFGKCMQGLANKIRREREDTVFCSVSPNETGKFKR